MRLKRWISFVLIFGIAASYIVFPPTGFAVSKDETVIADLTNINLITSSGLVPSSLYTKTGSFVAKWGDNNINNEIVIPISNGDKLKHGYIEFWVYSANNTDMEFAFTLSADDPETIDNDYYYTTIKTNWIGWRKLSFALKNFKSNEDDNEPSDTMTWDEYEKYVQKNGKVEATDISSSFSKSGTPLPITEIDSIKLWPSFAGLSPVSGTNLYFDKIVFTENKSDDAYRIGDKEDTKKLILVDYTNPYFTESKGYEYSTEHSDDGLGAAKIYGELLKKSSSYKSLPADWTEYNRLNFEIYSEADTRSQFSVGVYQDNPNTDGDDYYRAVINLDWANSWQTLSFTWDDEGKTSMEKYRTPLGFDKVTRLALMFTFSNNSMSEDTVFYLKRIYLDKQEKEKEVIIDNSVDYIPKHEAKYIRYDLEQGMKNTIERKQHPRLLCTPEEWEYNMNLYKSGDTYLTTTVNNVLKQADSYLDVPDNEYNLYDGSRLVRDERYAIKYCAFAFAVTGEQKYFDRMYRAIEVAAGWPDWNPSHWLDVAEMSYAYAIAYDLRYDSFTEAQKRVLRNGLIKNGIEQGCKTWRANGSVPRVSSNWQEVCAGGVGIASLALIDEPGYYDICAEFVNHAIKTLPTGLAMYGPDGAFPEGLSYWAYASKFFFNFDKALFNTIGTDHGLSQMEGLSKTGYFPILSSGPVSGFNYSDASESKHKVGDACMYYLAELYNEKPLATYRYQTSLNIGEFEDFLLYRDYLIEGDYTTTVPLSAHYGGEQDIIYAGSTIGDDATWIGFKGGANNTTHGDLDKGSFVLDMQGVRWIMDPGSGEYNTEGYWEIKPGGRRWTLYKKRAEGHSTVVINPANKANEDQIIDAYAKIIDYKESESGVYGIIDLTEIYAEDVTNATRGIALINNRSEVVIQDEIKADKPVEIYSFFPTKQNIMLTDNPKVAYMYTENGKKVRLDITSPSNAKWEVMDNVGLSTSPVHAENKAAGNAVAGQKLFVHLKNASNPTITVTIKSVFDGTDEPNPVEFKPLDDWDSYLEDTCGIDMLYIDGIPVNGFKRTNTYYALKGSQGQISADYDESKVSVEFKQGSKVGDTAQCKVTDKATGKVVYYNVSFEDVYIDIDPTSLEKINIINAEASAVPEQANVPANTYDGNMSNRWAAENEAWIIWELDGIHKIDQVLLSFWKGNARATKFDLYVSTDNINWTLVFSGKAAGNTEALEIFKLNGTHDAKYVKYYGYGNDQNGWNSIQEVYIPEVLQDFSDVTGHWAAADINKMRLMGFISGKTKTIFEPDSNITVAEFVSLITRCMGLMESEYKSIFADVSADDWYAENIQTAYDNGLLPDILVENGKINPNKDITREEMAVILAKAYGKLYTTSLIEIDLTKYDDFGEMTPKYREYISNSIAARLIKGRTSDVYAPKANATRAEAATILKRLYILKITSPSNMEITQIVN